MELNFTAPLSGVLVPLEKVPDPVFSNKLAGIGIAIDPTCGTVLAPCDGVVSQLHTAGHAIAVKSPSGLEILIHIGLDTVHLKGRGFSPCVKKGDQVLEGQELIRFDEDLVGQEAKSLLTLVLLTEPDLAQDFRISDARQIMSGESLFSAKLTRVGLKTGVDPARASSAVDPTAASLPELSGPLQVAELNGLHARPAASLVHLAKKFQSEGFLRKGNRTANLRSVTDILGLEVLAGDWVVLEARGTDARAMIEELSKEFKSGLPRSESPQLVRRTPDDVPSAVPGDVIDVSQFKGMIASPGLVIGPVFQFRTREVQVIEEGQSPAVEKDKMERAIKTARSQIDEMVEEIKKGPDPKKSLIFDSHLEILDDPSLCDRAQEGINRGKSASFAWKKAYIEVSERLQRLANPVLAGRAVDVRDVGQRVMRALAETETSLAPGGARFPEACPDRSILVAEEFTPSDFASLDLTGNSSRVQGLLTVQGGATSHVAILARSFGLPALVGVDAAVLNLANGTEVLLDAIQGELRIRPSAEETQALILKKAKQKEKAEIELSQAHQPAVTTDGIRVEVVANLKSSQEAATALKQGAEGVGLLRTEFLFMDREEAPSETEQEESYRFIAKAMSYEPGKAHPLVIRTLDVGGDKPLRYIPIDHEENPFLGERGIRISLKHRDIFRSQLRAILRASCFGQVKVMFPMITTLTELREAKTLLEEERIKLKVPPLEVGMMVEVPSTAILADRFIDEVDFFSIGSNDLTQYTLAMDRGHPRIASQADGLDPSVLRLIDRVVKAVRESRPSQFGKKWVGICGGLAGDPEAVPLLLGLGVDELSVSIPSIPGIKAQIRKLNRTECETWAQKALQASSASEIRSWMRGLAMRSSTTRSPTTRGLATNDLTTESLTRSPRSPRSPQ